MSIYDYNVKDMRGSQVSLEDYKGQVLLIVNTATGCGFTPQYEGLEKLYQAYKDRGFAILDFPCNQFGNQAPGGEEVIHSFCTLKYNVSFPQFAKIEVNGANESPLYTFLKKEKGGVLGSAIKWNFTKFLIDREGNIKARFEPTADMKLVREKIAELI